MILNYSQSYSKSHYGQLCINVIWNEILMNTLTLKPYDLTFV